MSQQADASNAILAMIAEDMFTAESVLAPLPDPRLAEMGWHVRGYLTAADTFRGQGQRLYYGFVAEDTAAPGAFIVVIRGTQRFIEWVIDAEFFLVPHPWGGRVEDGFYGVYQSMRYLTLDGVLQPLLPGLAGAFGTGAHVTFIGHSLGAAQANYLALDTDLVIPGISVAARLFASPRPGDSVFAQHFGQAVPDCCSYAYAPDIVPQVPLTEVGYSSLTSLVLLPKNVDIPDNPLSNHHAGNYAWLLDQPTAEAAGWKPIAGLL